MKSYTFPATTYFGMLCATWKHKRIIKIINDTTQYYDPTVPTSHFIHFKSTHFIYVLIYFNYFNFPGQEFEFWQNGSFEVPVTTRLVN